MPVPCTQSGKRTDNIVCQALAVASEPRIFKDATECFVQDNYYYLCEVEDGRVAQKLDGYEAGEKYTLEFVEPSVVIAKNRNVTDSPYSPALFEREVRVVEMLIEEGLLSIK